MSDAKARLRQRYGALLAALDASPAMQPFAHELRILLDPRPKQARLDAAIEQYIGRLTVASTRDQTSAFAGRLAAVLPRTSLERVPCDKVLRERLTAYHEKKRNFAAAIPHEGCELTYRSTIAST